MGTEVLLLLGSILLPSDTFLPLAEHWNAAPEHRLCSPAAGSPPHPLQLGIFRITRFGTMVLSPPWLLAPVFSWGN